MRPSAAATPSTGRPIETDVSWCSPLPLPEERTVLDWMEKSMVKLTCGGDCSNTSLPLLVSQCSGAGTCMNPTPSTRSLDYAIRHDEFLESLLNEQSSKVRTKAEVMVIPDDDSSLHTEGTFDANSSETSEPTHGDNYQNQTDAKMIQRKNRLKMNRSKSSSFNDNKLFRKDSSGSVSSSSLKNNNTGWKSNIHRRSRKKVLPDQISNQLSQKTYPAPISYLHPNCKLQKDQGKGKHPGSDICAKGAQACLFKVSQKIEMLTQITIPADPKHTAAPSFKRRPAKIVAITDQYTETRSIIQLSLGFLKLQYGVLLRWNPESAGKVVLVVLRKMCTDSFYKNRLGAELTPVQISESSEWLVMDNNLVVMQRNDGTEVSLLEPPYMVQQPDEFQTSKLSAQASGFQGLHPNSQWTLHVFLDSVTLPKIIAISYDEKASQWNAKKCLEWERNEDVGGDFALRVELWEKRRHKLPKLRLTSHIAPMATIKPASGRQRHECVSNGKKGIRFNVWIHHESEYRQWLFQELEMRKKKEVNELVWKLPLYRNMFATQDSNSEDDEDDALWDMCCLC